MNAENQVKEGRLKRWLDVALLASTLTSPFVNALLKRLRQREQSAQTVQEKKQAAQPDIRQRLEELTLESQQWVADQAQQLTKQARQLQAQSRYLRKALRREARQRRKLLVQMRKSRVGRGQDLLKRGERLSEGLVGRGGKITQDLLALGGKAAQDLTERSGGFAQELTARSGKVTHELTKRGEHLLEPLRKRGRNFWTIVGFIAGLLAAGSVTYLLVRRRMAQQVSEEDERIELPPSESWSGSQSRPVGEILHLDPRGATVATLEVVDLEETERPADAGFVGVVSTKQYYPIAMTPEAQDLVYFPSEEEARAQGFTAAE